MAELTHIVSRFTRSYTKGWELLAQLPSFYSFRRRRIRYIKSAVSAPNIMQAKSFTLISRRTINVRSIPETIRLITTTANIKQIVTSNGLSHFRDAYRITTPIMNGERVPKIKSDIFCTSLKHASYKAIGSKIRIFPARSAYHMTHDPPAVHADFSMLSHSAANLFYHG